jgi:mannose-6-phosphate isomerase-like protein (cupin superfamily)
MNIQRFSIDKVKDAIERAYSPVDLARVDKFVIRLVKFQGEFERRHVHQNEDEAFIVLEGEINFQTDDGDQMLKANQGIVIPKGLGHCPKASKTGPMPVALVIERAQTKRLGDD